MKRKFKICSLIIGMIIAVSVKAQVTNISHLGIFGDWCGWSSFTPIPLNIIHAGHYPINFLTDSIQRATIMPHTGYFGIGTNFIPQFKFDVDSGAVNIHMYKYYGYSIGGFEVLKIHGLLGNADTTNISVGVNAGRNIISGKENTMVGNQAGFSDSIESEETFIGYKAGYSTHSGPGNTMVGSIAGYSNTFGRGNVFEGNI